MVMEQQAKTILSRVKSPEMWFGVEYNVNVYRGCSHGCIYCDSRSECYGIDDFDTVTVKKNAPELLRSELSRKRRRIVVGTGSMSDPYIPAERGLRVTRQVLEVLAELETPVHITTKSDLVVRDLDLLQELKAKVGASLAVSLSTVGAEMAKKVEPFAPPPAARLKAMEEAAKLGICTGVLLMPVLPYLTDSPEDIRLLLQQAKDHGAQYIIPWFGMSLRDRQRDYYYRSLEELDPKLRQTYERRYGRAYTCNSPRAGELWSIFEAYCEENRLMYKMADVCLQAPEQQSNRGVSSKAEQLELF